MANMLRQIQKLIPIIIFFLAHSAFANSGSGLPLNLHYYMSQGEAITHLKAMDMYRVESKDSDMLAYIIPAPDLGTTNALFLKFSKGLLVQIDSAKHGMNKALYEEYMRKMLQQKDVWLAAGMEIFMENQKNNTYIYQDSKNAVVIEGMPPKDNEQDFAVNVAFIEKQFFLMGMEKNNADSSPAATTNSPSSVNKSSGAAPPKTRPNNSVQAQQTSVLHDFIMFVGIGALLYLIFYKGLPLAIGWFAPKE